MISNFRSRRLLRVTMVVAVFALAVSGCIEEPESPVFETDWLIPLGVLSYTAVELIEDDDSIEPGEDGVLVYHTSGPIDSVVVGDRLDVDLAGKTLQAEVGTVTISPGETGNYAFRFGDLYPNAGGGWTGHVPPFTFDISSSARDVPGFTEASIVSGVFTLRIYNDLPVTISAQAGPRKVRIYFVDPADASVVATVEIDEPVAAGDSALRAIDFAGVVVPDSLYARMIGGSPGSGLEQVDVNPDDEVTLLLEPGELEVDEAVAPVGEEEFGDSTRVAFPDSVRVAAASIASGVLNIDMSNLTPVTVDATITIPGVAGPTGAPFVLLLPVDAGGTAYEQVDLAGYSMDFDGELENSLLICAEVSTPGSGGETVHITSSDKIVTVIDPLALRFESVTGVLNQRGIDLGPMELDLEIPDEIESISLSRARLVITVRNGIEMPAFIDWLMEGTSEEGVTKTLPILANIAPALPGSVAVQEIVLDETNSELIPFLNNLPTDVIGTGSALFGDGVTEGTVTQSDTVSAVYEITTPLVFSLDSQTVEIDPEPIDMDEEDREELESRLLLARLEIRVESSFPVGGRAWILFDPDSSGVHESPELEIGPLEIPGAGPAEGDGPRGAAVLLDTIEINEEDVKVLLHPTLYMGVRVELPGTRGETVEFLESDRIEVSGVLRGRILMGDY